MIIFTVIFIIIALPVSLIGGLLLSQATTGVGLLCAACFLGILARIAQASAQHSDIQHLIEQYGSSSAE